MVNSTDLTQSLSTVLASTRGEEGEARASVIYKELFGALPEKVLRVQLPCSGRSLAALGPALAVEYRPHRGGAQRLEFDEPLPELAFDAQDKTLHLVHHGRAIEVSSVVSVAVPPRSLAQEGLIEAVKHYRLTHGGRAPEKVFEEGGVCPGRTLVSLGEVTAVEYRADKGDGPFTYRHEFRATRLPMLAVDVNTNKLHFVLGAYSVSNHGVEDANPNSRNRAEKVMGEYSIVANGHRANLGSYGARDNPGDGEFDYARTVGAPVLGLTAGLLAAVGVSYALDRWGGRLSDAWKGVTLIVGGALVGIGVAWTGHRALGVGLASGLAAVGAVRVVETWRVRSANGLPTPSLGEQPAGELFTPFPNASAIAAGEVEQYPERMSA